MTETPEARARKIVALILKATQRDATQAAIATAMGVSESTISRLLSDHIEKLAQVLAHAGLRVVSADARCFAPKDIDALLTMAQRHMNSLQGVSSLEWED